jgi:putative ABC transport system substrate-binding protein
MRRRDFVALIGAAAAVPFVSSRVAHDQPTAKPWRIGVIAGGEAAPTERPYSGFARGMRDVGYTEGKDFVIEWRSVNGEYERFAAVAQELVRLNVDIIVVATSAAVHPVRQETGHIPIVMAYSTDPVGSGFVESLSGPGGNITGLAGSSDDISPKQIELMLSVVPTMTRLGVLGNPDNPNYAPVLDHTEAAARNVRIATIPLQARNKSELDAAFEKFSTERVQAIKIIPDALIFSQRAYIADLALSHRLPSIAVQRECAEAGGLMSYGESLTEFFRRSATFVDKILKGAKPRDLPIEQSAKFELTLNLKTAKHLGIDMPVTLLALADEVIE